MKAKLVVESDGVTAECEIGHALIEGLIGYDFPALPAEHPLTDLLSRHPSSAVRRQVAESFELSDEIIERLESDPILAVREGLTKSNSTTKARLSQAFLSQIIHESIDAAESVVSNIGDFEEAEFAELTKALLGHSDPAVRKRAAQQELGTKSDRKRLKADDDPEVRRAVS